MSPLPHLLPPPPTNEQYIQKCITNHVLQYEPPGQIKLRTHGQTVHRFGWGYEHQMG